MIIRGPEGNIVRDLTEAEKQLGVDLKINQDGDLVLTNQDDLDLIAGGSNAAQAVFITLNVEPGELVYHPEKGVALSIGEKTSDAFDIKTQLTKSLTQDPRFENVQVSVTIEGNVVFIDGRVTLSNSGVEVPLKFVVPNR